MSDDRTEKISALKAFIAADKYEAYEVWGPGGDSGEADKELVNNTLNACAGKLMACYSAGAARPETCLQVLENCASEISDLLLDTEDREFAYEVFGELATIAGVGQEFAEDMNKSWFGDAGETREAGPEQEQVEEIHRQCMECGKEFVIRVWKRSNEMPAFWIILRCDACGETDYIEIPEGLLDTSYLGFEWLEMLDKNDFSREYVVARSATLSQEKYCLPGRNLMKGDE